MSAEGASYSAGPWVNIMALICSFKASNSCLI